MSTRQQGYIALFAAAAALTMGLGCGTGGSINRPTQPSGPAKYLMLSHEQSVETEILEDTTKYCLYSWFHIDPPPVNMEAYDRFAGLYRLRPHRAPVASPPGNASASPTFTPMSTTAAPAAWRTTTTASGSPSSASPGFPWR